MYHVCLCEYAVKIKNKRKKEEKVLKYLYINKLSCMPDNEKIIRRLSFFLFLFVYK